MQKTHETAYKMAGIYGIPYSTLKDDIQKERFYGIVGTSHAYKEDGRWYISHLAMKAVYGKRIAKEKEAQKKKKIVEFNELLATTPLPLSRILTLAKLQEDVDIVMVLVQEAMVQYRTKDNTINVFEEILGTTKHSTNFKRFKQLNTSQKTEVDMQFILLCAALDREELANFPQEHTAWLSERLSRLFHSYAKEAEQEAERETVKAIITRLAEHKHNLAKLVLYKEKDCWTIFESLEKELQKEEEVATETGTLKGLAMSTTKETLHKVLADIQQTDVIVQGEMLSYLLEKFGYTAFVYTPYADKVIPMATEHNLSYALLLGEGTVPLRSIMYKKADASRTRKILDGVKQKIIEGVEVEQDGLREVFQVEWSAQGLADMLYHAVSYLLTTKDSELNKESEAVLLHYLDTSEEVRANMATLEGMPLADIVKKQHILKTPLARWLHAILTQEYLPVFVIRGGQLQTKQLIKMPSEESLFATGTHFIERHFDLLVAQHEMAAILTMVHRIYVRGEGDTTNYVTLLAKLGEVAKKWSKEEKEKWTTHLIDLQYTYWLEKDASLGPGELLLDCLHLQNRDSDMCEARLVERLVYDPTKMTATVYIQFLLLLHAPKHSRGAMDWMMAHYPRETKLLALTFGIPHFDKYAQSKVTAQTVEGDYKLLRALISLLH